MNDSDNLKFENTNYSLQKKLPLKNYDFFLEINDAPIKLDITV